MNCGAAMTRMKRRSKMTSPKARTADWWLNETSSVEWNYSIVPPAGFVPKELPGRDDSRGSALLTEKYSTEKDGVVTAHLIFDLVKRRYTVAEATELRNKVAELIAGRRFWSTSSRWAQRCFIRERWARRWPPIAA